MAGRGRKINNFVEIWCIVTSRELEFHDSNKKYLFSKYQNIAEFKNLDDSEVPGSDFSSLRTSAASMTSLASATSTASTASKALFH